MKMNTSDITFMAFAVILLITGGYILYTISLIFPIPGSKFIIMSIYLSLILYFLLKKIKRIGIASLISVIFGLILSLFNIFMGLAIISTGLLTDLTTYILFKSYKTELSLLISAALYSFFSYITSIYTTNFISGNLLYKIVDIKIFIIIGGIIFILGFIGAKIGQHFYQRIKL